MRSSLTKFPEITDQGSRDFDESTTSTLNTINGNGEMIEGDMTQPLSSQSSVALPTLANAATTVFDSSIPISENNSASPLAPPRILVSSANRTSTVQTTNTPFLNVVNPNLTITPPNTSIMSSNSSLTVSQHNPMLSATTSHSDQTVQPPLNSSFRYTSRRKNILVQSVLAILLMGTIIAYICVWKFAETKQTYLHIIFIFLIVAEISIWERWLAAQKIYSEWDHPGSTARFWAPWNDPELQQRIAQRQAQNADVFDPEYPADFIPPPAYGNLRDSVLVDPNTGRALVTGTQAVAVTPPEYDTIVLRSYRRLSHRTLPQYSERVSTISTNRRQSRFSVLPFIQRFTNDPGEDSARGMALRFHPLRRSDSAPITSSAGPKTVNQRASISSFPNSHQN